MPKPPRNQQSKKVASQSLSLTAALLSTSGSVPVREPPLFLSRPEQKDHHSNTSDSSAQSD